MKKLIATLAIVLYIGTLAAPAMQVFSNANSVVTIDGNDPKDKKDTKTTAKTDKQKSEKKEAKCDGSQDAKKDCAVPEGKKAACCADKKEKK